jgi:hypothetical protein
MRDLATLGLVTAFAFSAPLNAQGGMLRIGVEAQSARVLAARVGSVVPERDVFLRGITIDYRRGGSPLGLQLRLQQSTRSDDLGFGVVAASYAIRYFAAEVGYGWRAGYQLSTGLAHGEQHRFARAGGAVSVPLGASPLSLDARAALYVPVSPTARSEDALSGFDGETALRWSLARWPVEALVGFRFERLRVYLTEQEVSALRVGAAWRWGRAR